MIAFTEWAVDILARADGAARRFNPDARLRLRADGQHVVFELTDEPEPGDRTIEHDAGFTLFVAEGLAGTVDVVEPHDRLILRPPGDTTRSDRGAHAS
ncbi:MAG TPA: hypothetical protein VLA82_10365 [Actinomycetota bacterium]|nr:hypothetical protein [Actinomycetota bacterium]